MSRRDHRHLYMDTSSRSWMVQIDDAFIQSAVSYYGLSELVPHCATASRVLKGRLDPTTVSKETLGTLIDSCKKLYGLLHQRYITSYDGIRSLESKYRAGIYGRCPRVACRQRELIPMGLSTTPGQDTVKLYCTQCHDIYDCDSDIDGAYFGPDLPMMFHKIMQIPLRFKVPSSKYLEEYEKPDGTVVPAIPQRLYRWAEKKEK